MCINIGTPANRVSFNFKPIQTSFKLLAPEVQGFGADDEPTQEDADLASSALGELYASLSPRQQAVIARLVLQASAATA